MALITWLVSQSNPWNYTMGVYKTKTEDRRPESLLMLELLKLQGNYGLSERFVPLQTKTNR